MLQPEFVDVSQYRYVIIFFAPNDEFTQNNSFRRGRGLYAQKERKKRFSVGVLFHDTMCVRDYS